MTITGTTRLFPIIGRPVEGVFSPPAFNAWLKDNALDMRMVAVDVAPDGLDDFLRFLRASRTFAGCSVTYPLKQAVFERADQKTDRAARLGALNTVRREADGALIGEATDGLAMVGAIREAGGTITGRSALILGAGGGAGQAIADALCEAGIGRVCLKDIDADREAQVIRAISRFWPDTEVSNDSRPADILVNATTLGKTLADPLPFTVQQIASARTVCDVVTGQQATPLISHARALQKAVVTGADMGCNQLAPQLRFLNLYP